MSTLTNKHCQPQLNNKLIIPNQPIIVLWSKLLGLFKKEQPVKSQAQIDQEAKDEEEVQAAYRLALKEQRIKNAKQQAIIEADKRVNQKPFYQKVIGAATAIGKDLASGAGNMNPDALFTWDEPQSKRQHKKKRRQQQSDFSLI